MKLSFSETDIEIGDTNEEIITLKQLGAIFWRKDTSLIAHTNLV